MIQKLVVDRPLAFIDLETTGVDPAQSRIVEIAVEIHWPDLREAGPERKVRRLNPGVPIPAEATAVHGITDADVTNEPTFRQVALGLDELLAPCDIAGFNIRRFDLPLLVAEFKRAGHSFDAKRLPAGSPRRIIDLQMLFHLENPRDLEAAVRSYVGREHEGAHSAEADTAALPLVLEGMLAKHAHLTATLDALHARCDEFQPYRTAVENWFGDDLSKPVFQFGKNKGTPLGRVDNGYLDWMLRQNDMDADVKAFIRSYLRKSA